MIRTYHGTTFHTADLEDATVLLYVHPVCKYDNANNLGEPIRFEFKGLTAWDIIEGGAEAEEIERETDADGIDEYHEYLVLHFKNGLTSTYRNSHVTLFIL